MYKKSVYKTPYYSSRVFVLVYIGRLDGFIQFYKVMRRAKLLYVAELTHVIQLAESANRKFAEEPNDDDMLIKSEVIETVADKTGKGKKRSSCANNSTNTAYFESPRHLLVLLPSESAVHLLCQCRPQ